nr:uncharacterized protein LOC116428061 [Nomia melanderi]
MSSNKNKNKIIEKYVLDESDSLEHQHSSLAVNLSCSSNLTNFENSLPEQVNVKYNVNVPSTVIVSNAISEHSKYNDSVRNGQTSVNTRCTAGHSIPLKHASIVLEKIENDAEILDKNCKKLKQVILLRTKQIFDPQNKLSVKTQEILSDKHDQSDTFQNNDCSNNLNCLCIDGTPKDRHKSHSSAEQRQHFKLNKRRLFDLKEDRNKNDLLTKCNSSISRQIQVDKKMYSNSSKSIRKNKNFGNSNISLNISSALILADEPKGNKTNCSTASNDRCPSSLNISENDSIFVTVPIGCSTMINNETLDNNHEIQHDITHHPSFHPNTKKDIIPMEITHIQRKCLLIDNQDSVQYNINNVSDNKILGENVLENNCAHVFESLCNNFKNTQILEEHSAKTTKTSLNVNTSINGSSRDDRNINKSKQKDSIRKSKNENIENEKDENICSTILEEARESVNTICTSLQMNTSLNTSNKLHLQVSNIDSTSLKLNSSISINEALSESVKRDIDKTNSVKIESTGLIKDQKSKSNKIYQDQANLIMSKSHVIIHKIQDGQSYVEATPYPAYRSVLLKTQLKQNAIVSNSIHRNSIEMNSFKTKKATSKSLTLNNSSSHNMSCVRLPVKSKCKRKLLSLHDSSQLLSFSPVENENILPERPMLRTRYKKGKKQHVKNKRSIVDNGSGVKRIDGKNYDQLVLKNDCTIFSNTKKQKRPKKVISKKFVIKRFANENFLGGLEENRGNATKVQAHICNRNSLNEFQTLKNVPTTQPSNKKTQRINIVVTGLCNDDKNIVKSVIKTLGHARIESNVTKRTTHVVTTGVRTINLLYGIIRGCWLVTFEWVLRSLENNSWLNPEEYEITHFSKAVLENRKDRQLFGASYVSELFAACGSIYIGKGTTPPYDTLKDLIKTAGGQITECPEAAKIIIHSKGLKESWVLDCITTGELQPFHLYQRL